MTAGCARTPSRAAYWRVLEAAEGHISFYGDDIAFRDLPRRLDRLAEVATDDVLDQMLEAQDEEIA
jgi:hypothetical protein